MSAEQMNAERTLVVAAAMNRLPSVRWDRFIYWEYDTDEAADVVDGETAAGCLVYGWIDRADGHRARLVEVKDRLAALNREWDGRLLPEAAAREWGTLQRELEALERLRSESRSDFVTLHFETVWGWSAEQCAAMTSSAERSVEIQTLLHGNADGHQDCERVHMHFQHLVHNVVADAAG